MYRMIEFIKTMLTAMLQTEKSKCRIYLIYNIEHIVIKYQASFAWGFPFQLRYLLWPDQDNAMHHLCIGRVTKFYYRWWKQHIQYFVHHLYCAEQIQSNQRVVFSATRREITCFTFDNGFNGMFYEWVKVSNVVRVSTGCKYGSCAFFGGLNSSLEIPRFALAYRFDIFWSYWTPRIVMPCLEPDTSICVLYNVASGQWGVAMIYEVYN